MTRPRSAKASRLRLSTWRARDEKSPSIGTAGLREKRSLRAPASELVANRAHRDAEARRGARAIATRFAKRGEDEIALGLLERGAREPVGERRRRDPRGSEEIAARNVERSATRGIESRSFARRAARTPERTCREQSVFRVA